MHIEVVDIGEIICLSNDDVIFHCTNEEVKCLMRRVFNKNKKDMVIGSTDQESFCCTFDIGTSFHELLNNHNDHIRKDSVFMFRPSVDEFMLKVKKKLKSFSSKKTSSLMKSFDILLCCKLCGEEVYKLKEDGDFQTCNQDLYHVFNEHFRNGKKNKCC